MSWRVTLHRPEKRKRAARKNLEELIAALREASAGAATRVIVIDRAGPAFLAGHHRSEMIGRDEAFYRELLGVCTRVATPGVKIERTPTWRGG